MVIIFAWFIANHHRAIFFRGIFGLTVNLSPNLFKKKWFNPCNAQVATKLFLRRTFFLPQSCYCSAVYVHFTAFFIGPQGDPTILGSNLEYRMHLKAQFYTVGKKLYNSSQFAWKLFLLAVSVNFCKKRSKKYPLTR